MKTLAIVTLNELGITQGENVKSALSYQKDLSIDIYTMAKYLKDGLLPIEGRIVDFTRKLFKTYDAIVYVMAMGIVVRSIAPYIVHKSHDPAVLCLSVDGHNIIPVLSGHIGGANELAGAIAEKLQIKAVITTASDLLGVTAVDMIAKANDFIIDDYTSAKDVTALAVDGEKVALLSEVNLKQLDITGITQVDTLNDAARINARGLIYIGYKTYERLLSMKDNPIKLTKLIPKCLVLGIGARKNIPYEQIQVMLDTLLNRNNIDVRGIAMIASIDIKKNEEGIVKLSKALEVPYVTYDAMKLNEVIDVFEQSDFVRKITGVGAVAMPSGYIASNYGRCILKKIAQQGITMCLWEMAL